MLQCILFFVLILLSIVGLCEVIYFFVSFMLKPKRRPRRYVFVYLDKDCAESQVLAELFNLHWFGEKMADKLVFLTSNLTAEQKRNLKKEYQNGLVEFKNGAVNERES